MHNNARRDWLHAERDPVDALTDKPVAVSLIIPTFNRRVSLERTIASARQQSFPDTEFEIIVVDNGSTDGTRDLVEQLNQDGGKRLGYIYEQQPGLHHARHAGACAATGGVLVFTDDDATFDAGWLQSYATAFHRYPEMAAAGGPVRPRWEVAPPGWLLELLTDTRMLVRLSLRDVGQEFRLDPQGSFYGVNMAIRRQVLFGVGGFNPDSFGDTWLGDGEDGLVRKLHDGQKLIGYLPDAIVYHHIPSERMTRAYLYRRAANEGACVEYARFHKGIPHSLGLSMRMMQILLGCCKLGPVTLGKIISNRERFVLLKARIELEQRLSRLRYVGRLLHDEDFRQLVRRDGWLEPRSHTPL